MSIPRPASVPVDLVVPDGEAPLPLEPIARTDTAPEPKRAARASSSRLRLHFPEHLRAQADGWLTSGSLSLPHCSSPRHSRAVQRALLLALLADPGYEVLPLGLKQRVGWLFSPGWERQTTGSFQSEVSDLMTILGASFGVSSPLEFMKTLRGLIPDPLPLVRPPSSYPPVRR